MDNFSVSTQKSSEPGSNDLDFPSFEGVYSFAMPKVVVPLSVVDFSTDVLVNALSVLVVIRERASVGITIFVEISSIKEIGLVENLSVKLIAIGQLVGATSWRHKCRHIIQSDNSNQYYRIVIKYMMKQPSLQNSSEQPPIYKKIQNYIFKFSDLLGQGNFSKVYKAHNQITNDIVAIKIVQLESLKSKKLEELLFSEIDILKKLNHASILRCFEVFTSNRNCYIITQLCNEGDLQSRLRKERYYDEGKIQHFMRDIFEGLVYLAQKNVIHRDLKVANVFLNNGKAKIADFGFAKFTKEKFKDINIGSPIYMSPQGFIYNIYGPKTDVWAFGILIYELLHGETPFAMCRTEAELKQSLSIPLKKSKLRHDISPELKDVILRCMEIDQVKRISVFQLASMPYFRRLTGKDVLHQGPMFHNSPSIHNSAFELRLRTPSYNGQPTKLLKSEQVQIKRKVSIQKMPPTNYGHSKGYETSNEKYNNIPMSPPQTTHFLQVDHSAKDRRATSTDKNYHTSEHHNNPYRRDQSSQKPYPINAISKKQLPPIDKTYKLLSSALNFKQCVNVLHYGRLIFKFVATLKVSDYCNENQMLKLSKWLMQILDEIRIKIDRKQIVYEGDNSDLREKKLKQVRGEYQKKYKSELNNYFRNSPFGSQTYTLEYIKNYCYTLYQKYDSLISKQNNKSLLVLGHSIIMICDATRLLAKCFDEKNFGYLSTYKELETYLNISKDQIDINSYLNYRKKMIMYY